MGSGEVTELSLELGNGIAALRGDLASLRELIFEKRRLVRQGGDSALLRGDRLCGGVERRSVSPGDRQALHGGWRVLFGECGGRYPIFAR